jgi:hypothetical protein
MSDMATGDVGTRRSSWHPWPQSKLGWWAIGLTVAFVVFMALNGPLFMSGLVHLNQTTGPIWAVIWFGTGVVAGILSVIAITAGHDKSVLLFIPLLPLAFVAFFLAGEFLFPH